MQFEYETDESPFVDQVNKIALIGKIIEKIDTNGYLSFNKTKKYPYGDLFDNLYERPVSELKLILKMHNQK